MRLEQDQARTWSHSNPQCQAHLIPPNASDIYGCYVEGLQLLQWLLFLPQVCQQVSHYVIPKEPD